MNAEMIGLQGTIKNGQIVLDAPVALPDGTRVEVLPIQAAPATLGMREEDWPTTQDGIAALLARMDQVEPGWLSPDDDDTWRVALRCRRSLRSPSSSRRRRNCGTCGNDAVPTRHRCRRRLHPSPPRCI